MLRDANNPYITNSIWHFIGGAVKGKKSFEDTIIENVEIETGIKLKSVEFLSKSIYKEREKFFYHAVLTDEHVNNMQRRADKLIQFFTLKELDKLTLASSTRQLILKHKDILENLPRVSRSTFLT